MVFKLTEVAAKEVKRLMAELQTENVVLRIGVQGGGCSGLSYALKFDDEIGQDDKVFELNGIRVAMDKRSSLFLNGATLDFVQDGLQTGFTFINPNVRSTCGCGHSFTPKEVPENPSGS